MKPALAKTPEPNALEELGRATVQIVHDLKNQLNGLKLYATFLRKRLERDDRAIEERETLEKLIADDQVKLTIAGDVPRGPASPMRPDIMKAVGRLTDTMWPGVMTVPIMVMGATDGRSLRVAGIPTYGIQGFFMDRDDMRMHGRDERMKVQSFYEGQQFLYELVKTLSAR